VSFVLTFRDSASFGKRQEFTVTAELLRRGYDVYQTLVDDQQIDCIIRKGKQPSLARAVYLGHSRSMQNEIKTILTIFGTGMRAKTMLTVFRPVAAACGAG
jgi:hypothetical protein